MNWQFTIPGQPPSVNHMYQRTRNGGIRKTTGVEAYQAEVTLVVRTTRPSGWKPPEGQLRLFYDIRLKRDIDCDNLLKALNDAIAIGLDMNDKQFLPCVRSKVVGLSYPTITITVEQP